MVLAVGFADMHVVGGLVCQLTVHIPQLDGELYTYPMGSTHLSCGSTNTCLQEDNIVCLCSVLSVC